MKDALKIVNDQLHKSQVDDQDTKVVSVYFLKKKRSRFNAVNHDR